MYIYIYIYISTSIDAYSHTHMNAYIQTITYRHDTYYHTCKLNAVSWNIQYSVFRSTESALQCYVFIIYADLFSQTSSLLPQERKLYATLELLHEDNIYKIKQRRHNVVCYI